MKKALAVIALFAFIAVPVGALPLQIDFVDGPQDPLALPTEVHELGTGFPIDEEILSTYIGETDETSCFDGSDDPFIINQFVDITNLSPFDYLEVHYVADPETVITNYDGWIGNVGAGDQEEAFRIDNVGINQPLVFESMVQDLVFQAGETWRFILQDYQHPQLPPSALGSMGIASLSTGDPLSSGSIIGIVPEPGTYALLALGGLALAIYRRKRS